MMMMSVVQTILRQTICWLMNNELEGIWKERLCLYVSMSLCKAFGWRERTSVRITGLRAKVWSQTCKMTLILVLLASICIIILTMTATCLTLFSVDLSVNSVECCTVQSDSYNRHLVFLLITSNNRSKHILNIIFIFLKTFFIREHLFTLLLTSFTMLQPNPLKPLIWSSFSVRKDIHYLLRMLANTTFILNLKKNV